MSHKERLTRLWSAEECRKITDKYPEDFTFDVEAFFADKRNFAVIKGRNVGLAEYVYSSVPCEDVYKVHMCFDTARGKEAVELAREMLFALFMERDCDVVMATVNLENKKSRMIVSKIGFESTGIVKDNQMYYMLLTKRSLNWL